MAFKLGEGVIQVGVQGLGALRGGLASIGARMKGVGASITSMGWQSQIAFAGLTGALGYTVKAAADAELSGEKLRQVLAQQGNATGLSAEELTVYATELQKTTGFEDDATKAAMAMLATMSNVRGDIFKRTVAVSMDIAARKGLELSAVMSTVGRSMNNPLLASRALRTAGVLLSAEQEKQMRAAMALGDVQKAQGIVVGALESAYKGAATAQMGTFGGQMRRLQSVAGDLMEEIGGALLPTLTAFANALSAIVPKVSAFAKEHAGLIAKIAGGAVAFAGMFAVLPMVIGYLGPVIKLLGMFINPIGAIVGILGVLGGKFLWASIKGESFGDKISSIAEWVAGIWATVKPYWDAFLDYVSWIFTAVIMVAKNWKLGLKIALTGGVLQVLKFVDTLKWAFTQAAPAIFWYLIDMTKWAFTDALPKLMEWFGRNWKALFEDLVMATSAIITNLFDNFVNFFKAIGNLAKGQKWDYTWQPLLQGFKRTTEQLPDVLKTMPSLKLPPIEAGEMTKDVGKNLDKLTGEMKSKIAEAWKKKKGILPEEMVTPTISPEKKGGDQPYASAGKKSGGTVGGTLVGLTDMAKNLQAAAFKVKSPEQMHEEAMGVQEEQLDATNAVVAQATQTNTYLQQIASQEGGLA